MDFLVNVEVPPGVYNTFNGFRGETLQLDKDDIENSRILYHIKVVVCNNDDKMLQYMMSWLARMIQCPGNQNGRTACILKGIDGTGKDTIFKWFGEKILGKDYYLNEDKVELLFGKFNGCLENKILVTINETNSRATKDIMDGIKKSITREFNTIDRKGHEAVTVRNLVHFSFATNHNYPLKLSPTDRRFFGCETNNDYATDDNYFKPLFNEITSGCYDKAFYDYFKTLDISKIDFIADRPQSSLINDMREMSIPPVARFLHNLIESNDETQIQITLAACFAEFNQYTQDTKHKCDFTYTAFGQEMKRYKGVGKKRSSSSRYYNIDIKVLKEFLTKQYKFDFSHFIEE